MAVWRSPVFASSSTEILSSYDYRAVPEQVSDAVGQKWGYSGASAKAQQLRERNEAVPRPQGPGIPLS